MSKKINVCSVNGVVYHNDTKNKIKISQAGRFHLLVECAGTGNTVKIRSIPNGFEYKCENLASDTDVQVFLISMDTVTVEEGAELVIITPTGALIYELKA